MIQNMFKGVFDIVEAIRLLRKISADTTKIITKIEILQVATMANFQDVMQGIQANVLASADVLDTVDRASVQIKDVLQAALDGDVDEQEIQSALQMLQTQKQTLTSVKTAILGLAPSIPTPEQPLPSDSPLPSPLPIPTTPDTIDVAPATGDALPGTFKIDIK